MRYRVMVKGVWGTYVMHECRWRWLARFHTFMWTCAPNALGVWVETLPELPGKGEQ